MQLALGANKIADLYHIDNFTEQSSLWNNVWTNRKHTGDWEMHVIELVDDTAALFYSQQLHQLFVLLWLSL